MLLLSKIRFRANRFSRDEEGAATIEAVLWLPIFVMLVGLLADVSMMFHGQTRLLRIVQDANRQAAVGRLKPEEIVNFIKTQSASLSPRVEATASISSLGVISTTATIPLMDIDVFGMTGLVPKARMGVQAEHLQEDY